MGYYKVTWQTEVDASDPLDAARKAMAARAATGSGDHHYTVDDGFTVGVIDLNDE